MKVRRGLQFAAIHFAVAAVLVGWEVDRAWRAENQLSGPHVVHAAWQEGESEVIFDPCHGKGYVDYWTTPQETTVETDNLPAWALSGWSVPCPVRWTIAGMLESDSFHFSFRKYLVISAAFCALIPVQWFLLGAFPLVTPQRWFLEPGTVITICTLILTFLIPLTDLRIGDVISTLLMAIQLLAWLYWLVLAIWKGLRGLSRRYRAQPAALP